jgi:ABC-2 type transport system ATP-binding protein
MSHSKYAIEVKNLSKRFKSFKAINDISFSVEHGSIVGFVGPNGAGKTTTISCMMGFLRPTNGSVSLLGEQILPETAHRQHINIGYAAGDMALFDNLTGQQYLEHLGYLTQTNNKRRAELIEAFSPVLHKKLHTLSRGNKQKIALIAALQHQPKLLILDEPTSGLDPLMQETFLAILRDVSQKGTTVFMSSHILNEVTDVCERVLFMKQGEIVLDKAVKELEQEAGKEIRIQSDKQTIARLIRTKPKGTVVQPESTMEHAILFYKGTTAPLLNWLSSQKIDDIEIRDRDFDSIFHKLYEEDEQ